MATTTNYDQSSTGVDLSLTVFADADLSRMEFSENMKVIHQSNRNGDGYFWFTNYGQREAPGSVGDCLDLSSVTAREARAWLVGYLKSEWFSVRDIVRECFDVYDADWNEYLSETIADFDMVEYLRDGLPDGGIGIERYATCSVSGYSQGDYAIVLYDPSIWTGEYDPQAWFNHLFYDAPTYAMLTVDGTEFDLVEALEDYYDWDRDKVTEHIRTLSISEDAKAWAIDNLPEYPEYQ